MTISRLVKQTSCSFSKKITNIFQSRFMYSSKIATMKPHPLVASFDPHGLNVLLVDNTFTSLFVISRMLEYCDYQVTPCTQPTEALMLLRNGDIKFDMVLTEVHFSQDMSGMKFLEIVQRETDLPVVIVSAEDRIKIMKESVIKGACAYVVKPMGMGIVRFLWQHVIRKKMFGVKQIDNVEEGEPNSSQSGEEKEFCASSDGVHVEDEQVKTPGKKLRLVWTDELHQKFVDAVTQLGIQNAVPKKVLKLMNVPGLTRGNVASHLQKFRLSLGKITTHTQKGFTWPKSAAGSSTTENNGLRL